MQPHQVEAFNTAAESDNKIHDDEVAAKFGFKGGLVPGVDVYAYMTHLPVEEWGMAWLERGTISARFALPAYDGQLLSISDAGGVIEVRDPGGVVLASGAAGLATKAVPVDPAAYGLGERPEPDARPPASPESLPVGAALGAIEATFRAERAAEYLGEVRESLPIYVERGVAHPGWLLRFANSVLAANVTLGPWMHVSSEVANLSVVHDGERVQTRARVADAFERKGHRFVTLDVLMLADGVRPVAQVTHTAIYRPRQVAE
ncbi:MAG: hypothetical protein ACKVWR_04170 [Acidimicrobiales bacterium]